MGCGDFPARTDMEASRFYIILSLILTFLFSSALIFIPWWLYYYRGDVRVLQNHYDGMKGYVDFEYGRASNNIVSTALGDWVSPETSPLGGNAPEDMRIAATAYV
jgi:alpha-L-rhamnosidase